MQFDAHQQLFTLTAKLVSYQSVSPEHAGSLDYIATYLENIGFVTSRLDRGKTSNLLARFGTGDPLVAFAGHVDVVPPGETTSWKYDPFQLTQDGDKLYGRGIADMKGAIAAFMVAVQEFLAAYQSNKNVLDGSIMLLITSDEEAAATDGTTVMVDYLKHQNMRIKYCILGEPSSVDVVGDMIRVGRRGSLTGHLEIFGKQGHVAYPQRCDNPVHTCVPALTELLGTTWDNGNSLFPPTSMQITNLHAGLGVDNVTPEKLDLRINFRFNDRHSADSLTKMVTQILDKHKLRYTAQWINSAKPFCSKIGYLANASTEVIKEQSGILVSQDTGGGTSDGRFLIDVCDEIIELGMLNGSIHQVNEWVPLDDLVKLKNIYAGVLSRLFCDTQA